MGAKEDEEVNGRDYPLHEELDAILMAHKILIDSAVSLYPDNPAILAQIFHGAHAFMMQHEMDVLSKATERLSNGEKNEDH